MQFLLDENLSFRIEEHHGISLSGFGNITGVVQINLGIGVDYGEPFICKCSISNNQGEIEESLILGCKDNLKELEGFIWPAINKDEDQFPLREETDSEEEMEECISEESESEEESG